MKLARGGRWRIGVYAARELARLGVWPGSCDTECMNGCQCGLQRVAKPAGTPRGTMLTAKAQLELSGPKASSFTGDARSEREGFARNVKRNGWTHKGKRR